MAKTKRPSKSVDCIRVNVIFKGAQAERLELLCEVSGLDHANLIRFLVTATDPEKLKL